MRMRTRGANNSARNISSYSYEQPEEWETYLQAHQLKDQDPAARVDKDHMDIPNTKPVGSFISLIALRPSASTNNTPAFPCKKKVVGY
jgi:hypothetical protein